MSTPLARHLRRAGLLVGLAALVPQALLPAQEVAAPVSGDTISGELPRVFLDCQASGCDFDFFRTELTWLSFVRDRNQADVYVLVTERTTGGGGREYTVMMNGQGARSALADTAVSLAPQGATSDELRRVVSRALAQGMLRFVRATPLAARLNVVYQTPRGLVQSATRGARDRWNLWVFRVGVSGYTNGDANYESTNVFGSFRASRTTAMWKTSLSVSGDYSENHYTLSTGEIVNYQHGYSADALLVKSIGGHWSMGLQANLFSSLYSNTDLSLRIGPAIEYDLLPYDESTRHQVVFRYGVGLRSLNYDEITIYDKMEEQRPDHSFIIGADVRRSWGNVGGGVNLSQYLDDMTKRRVDIYSNVRWRIVTGLEFNLSGGYTQIRDQLNIPRGSLTDEDILIRLRQLQTGYRFYGSVGLSYTFGSVFNNVVNPRFSQNMGGGGIFFF